MGSKESKGRRGWCGKRTKKTWWEKVAHRRWIIIREERGKRLLVNKHQVERKLAEWYAVIKNIGSGRVVEES